MLLVDKYAASFSLRPRRAERKGGGNRNVFAELFSKSDPPEA